MTPEEQKKVLVLAAQAAREMIEERQQRRAKLEQQIATIDSEIERLLYVASFDGVRPPKISSTPTEPGRTAESFTRVRGERKHNWVAILTEVIGASEPGGIIYTDLVRTLKAERGHKHSNDHIKKLLERKEGELFYRDE